MFDLSSVLKKTKRLFSKKDWLYAAFLLCLYFITRMIKLDKFPIFSDEGIYIRWAKVAWHDATWRFISLTDGRQPLQTWGTIPFLKLFPTNALLAGRLFSVATGLVALIGIFSLLYYLFGKKTAFIGAFFYLLTPYFLFYDRIALVDSAVNASFIWILFFSILMADYLRLDLAIIFGLVAGMGLLAKSSVKLFLGLSLFAPILFFSTKKIFFRKTLNYIVLFLLVIILALIIYNVQRLSPYLHFVTEKNKTFIVPFEEYIKNPFALLIPNLKNIPKYVFWEMGFVLGIIGLAGWLKLLKEKTKLFVYLSLWILGSFFAVASFARVLFPRYVIFFSTLFLITASFFVSTLKNKKILIPLVILYLISIAYFDYTILFDYKNVPFPDIDRGQYVEGWTAGWGMKEIVDYAREKSKEKPVILIAEGNFGLAGDVLDTFVKPDDKIEIRAYWPLGVEDLLKNQQELKDKYIFVVLSHQMQIPEGWPIQLIKKYDKPNNQSVIYLLELK